MFRNRLEDQLLELYASWSVSAPSVWELLFNVFFSPYQNCNMICGIGQTQFCKVWFMANYYIIVTSGTTEKQLFRAILCNNVTSEMVRWLVWASLVIIIVLHILVATVLLYSCKPSCTVVQEKYLFLAHIHVVHPNCFPCMLQLTHWRTKYHLFPNH